MRIFQQCMLLVALVAYWSITLADETILKVSVFANGQIELNGRPTTIGAVSKEFELASRSGGVVWYYRESSQSEPPPEAMKIIELVVENKLAISMSTKPDFSDYLDQNGVSRPR